MAVIDWKKVYETGIVALDEEHKGLVLEINRLYEAVRDKRGEMITAEILNMLEVYTSEHFQHEERLMGEYHYPELGEHKAKHQQMIDTVQSMKLRSVAGSEALAVELLRFLREWLMDHILTVDKKYGAFLESRGGRFIE